MGGPRCVWSVFGEVGNKHKSMIFINKRSPHIHLWKSRVDSIMYAHAGHPILCEGHDLSYTHINYGVYTGEKIEILI
jgi:hypothetical protein